MEADSFIGWSMVCCENYRWTGPLRVSLTSFPQPVFSFTHSLTLSISFKPSHASSFGAQDPLRAAPSPSAQIRFTAECKSMFCCSESFNRSFHHSILSFGHAWSVSISANRCAALETFELDSTCQCSNRYPNRTLNLIMMMNFFNSRNCFR